MDVRTEKLLKLAGKLQDCLREADELHAQVAAIKILEAHEAILDLEDRRQKKYTDDLPPADSTVTEIRAKG